MENKNINEEVKEKECCGSCDEECACECEDNKEECSCKEAKGNKKHKAQIEELKEEVNKYRDLYLRTLAETENFKKRINDEKIKDRKYASYSFCEKIISPIDLFDKVVSYKPDDDKLRNYLIGFEMINNQLKQVLSDEGVKEIKSLHEVFDPRFHQAVETVWDENYDENVIIVEMQKGYMYKDRVLRASLVKVNKKPINEEEN